MRCFSSSFPKRVAGISVYKFGYIIFVFFLSISAGPFQFEKRKARSALGRQEEARRVAGVAAGPLVSVLTLCTWLSGVAFGVGLVMWMPDTVFFADDLWLGQ